MAVTQLNDAISGDRAEQLASDLGHQKSRLVIKEVVEEYVGSSAFAERVKAIILEALEADPARNKLKVWVQGVIKEDSSNRGWRNLTFWIPTIIAAIAVAVAFFKP